MFESDLISVDYSVFVFLFQSNRVHPYFYVFLDALSALEMFVVLVKTQSDGLHVKHGGPFPYKRLSAFIHGEAVV